jgi:hypothetical protein
MKDNVKIAKDYTDWHIKHGGFARDMTMRDYFASKAMQSLITAPNVRPMIEDGEVSKWAYKMADAMLKERAK